MRSFLSYSVILLLFPCCLAQQRKETTPAAEPRSAFGTQLQADELTFGQRYPRYRLRPGDVFDVSFEYTPEFNQTITIQPDGFISLRQGGEINVQGRTVPELTEAIRNAYSKILSRPTISVVLKDFEKPYFIANGQLHNPGKYDLRGDTTVVQAVAIAGGFLPSAKHSQVVLFRRVSDNWVEAHVLNIKKMENSRDLREDVHLRPGDMIFVPKNAFSKFAQFIPNSNMSLLTRTY